MGIKSEAFTAPLAFAQLAQRAASVQKALQLPAGMAALIKECETRTIGLVTKFGNFGVSESKYGQIKLRN